MQVSRNMEKSLGMLLLFSIYMLSHSVNCMLAFSKIWPMAVEIGKT